MNCPDPPIACTLVDSSSDKGIMESFRFWAVPRVDELVASKGKVYQVVRVIHVHFGPPCLYVREVTDRVPASIVELSE